MSLAKHSPMLARLETPQNTLKTKGLKAGTSCPLCPSDPFSPQQKRKKRRCFLSLMSTRNRTSQLMYTFVYTDPRSGTNLSSSRTKTGSVVMASTMRGRCQSSISPRIEWLLLAGKSSYQDDHKRAQRQRYQVKVLGDQEYTHGRHQQGGRHPGGCTIKGVVGPFRMGQDESV